MVDSSVYLDTAKRAAFRLDRFSAGCLAVVFGGLVAAGSVAFSIVSASCS